MKDDEKGRPVVGTVLPPERPQTYPLVETPIGIPLLLRARYWSTRRTIESFNQMVAAKRAAVEGINALGRARVELERTRVQLEHLDDVRRIEELKVMEELSALIGTSELREIQIRTAKAQAEADAILAERRLEEIKNPPTARPEISERSPAEQAATDIVAMRREAEELRKTLVECYGGEDKLTDDDRDLLATLEVSLRNRIAERLERL